MPAKQMKFLVVLFILGIFMSCNLAPKKEQKENAEMLKKKKIEDAAEKRYLKDSEKVAKKEAKMVNQDFNFDMSEADVQRQQAVSQSLAMYDQMRKTKLQG